MFSRCLPVLDLTRARSSRDRHVIILSLDVGLKFNSTCISNVGLVKETIWVLHQFSKLNLIFS